MTNQERAEANIKIAEALGFERYWSRKEDMQGNFHSAISYWRYPEHMSSFQVQAPEDCLPDFVSMIFDTHRFAIRNYLRYDRDTSGRMVFSEEEVNT